MADPTLPLDAQTDIEMPNGIVLSGNGGDTTAIQTAIEERHDEHEQAAAVASGVPAATSQERKTRGQRRFDELTAAREEERRRADAAEAKAKALESRLAQQQTPPPVAPQPVAPQPVPQQPQQQQQPPQPQATRPKPLEIEVGTKYDQYADYVEDLADWKAEQRILADRTRLYADLDARTTQRIEADRASRTRKDFVENTVFKNGQAEYADFDTVLHASTKIVPFLVQEAILKLPQPEHAIYALAQDEAQVDRLIPFLNDPMRLGIEVAQLMPRKASPSPASTPTVVRTTNAPSPIQPVGAGTRTTTPTVEDLAKAGDYDGYKAMRAQQLKSAR